MLLVSAFFDDIRKKI